MKLPLTKFTRDLLAIFLVALLFAGCDIGSKKVRILDRADRDFKAGEYDKAKIEYLSVLRLDRQNVIAFRQLGLIWSEQGVPFRAIPFLMKVRELAPNDIPARSKLALAFMSIGDRARARTEAVALLQQDPGNSDAIILLADTSQSQEEVTAAEQALTNFPHKETAAFHLATASLAIKRSDIGAASDQVQQALAADPKSARAHLVMGYMHILRRNPSHAGGELKIAAELAPLRSEERIKYAEFQAANGSTEEAKTLLQEITKKAPDYVPAWRDLAQLAITEKKYDEALPLLENILSRDADNAEARVLQAGVWLAKGDQAKAIASLEKLNVAYSNNPLLKFQLARALVISNKPAQAIAALEQAIGLKPDYAEAALLLAELNLRSGKPDAVVAAMLELANKRPDLPQVSALLANGYQMQGRLDDAVAVLRERIKASPKSWEGYLLLGVILRQQKKMDEARQILEKAREIAPDNLNVLNQLVQVDLAERKFDAALERVRQHLDKNPSSAGGFLTEGAIYAAKNDWPGAEAAFQKAIQLDENLAGAYEQLVGAYMRQNKMPQALAQLQAMLNKNPKNQAALITSAVVYDQTKEYSKARDFYEKVLLVRPDSVPALNNLAWLYADRFDQLDKAEELATKARSAAPAEPRVADTLGWVLYKKRDYQRAFAILQECGAKLPDDPEIQFHLGMASYMMGQTAAARAAFQQALKSPVDFPSKEEAKRRLAATETSQDQKVASSNSFEKQLTNQPGDVVGWMRLGESFEAEQNPTKAADAYEHARQLNPNMLAANVKLAQLYAGPLRDSKKALELARKARDLSPVDAEIAGTLGSAVLHAGNYQWAYSLLQESARQRSTDPAVLRDLAWSAYYLGKVGEARQAMQKVQSAANAASPERKDAEQFLALTSIEENPNHITALESQIEPALQSRSDYLPALVARAASQGRHGQFEAAIEGYRKILSRYPDFAPAQRDLAALYAIGDNSLDKAGELASRARKSLPDDVRLTRLQAEISFRRKDYAHAIQLFEQSARKQRLDAASLYQLGVAEIERAKTAEGLDHLRAAIAAGLDGARAAEAQRRIAAAESQKQQ